jgi:P-aminobenzoate N-oxygenase AurF
VSTRTPQPSNLRYISVIPNWDTRSAVRTKPRRLLLEEEHHKHLFSSDMTPVIRHPLTLSCGEEVTEEILTQRLYAYLDFTTILEQQIVNPVVIRLSRDAFGIQLPEAMRFDAYRIYCDEAYHALFSADIMRQVQESTGVLYTRKADPIFRRAIHRAKAAVPAEAGGLVEFCATVVSETLISGSLTRIPQDPDVVSFVRDAIADHAADERTHHAYFTKVFEVAWPQIDKHTQQELAPHFADFILGFLTPDREGQQSMLTQLGFTAEKAAQIVWEAHPIAESLSDTRHAARCTMRLLDRMGVTEYSNAQQHFHDLGLLDK